MNQKGLSKPIILFGIIFALLVLGGYFLNQQNQKSSQESKAPNDKTESDTVTHDTLLNQENVGAKSTCSPTGQDVQGPFYLPNVPFRTVLVPYDEGEDMLYISGKVLNTNCEPLAGAIVDIWHTDSEGNYDSSESYLYRGKVRTNEDGGYEFETYKFETTVPGRYPLGDSFRPAHIHIKVSYSGYVPLTTQLYFKGDPYLAPNDPCASCKSGDSTHVVPLEKNLTNIDNGNILWTGIFDIVLDQGNKEISDSPTYR